MRTVGRPGFTLIDMLTTVAALIIVMGLMISLARDVRRRSAVEVTKQTLIQLEMMLDMYEAAYRDSPPVPPLLAGRVESWDENQLAAAAKDNSRAYAALVVGRDGAAAFPRGESAAAGVSLPYSAYDGHCVRDGWGMPVALMTRGSLLPRAGRPQADRIGQGRRFFLSAGPDRRYATQEDNVYSKDLVDSAKSLMQGGGDAGHGGDGGVLDGNTWREKEL